MTHHLDPLTTRGVDTDRLDTRRRTWLLVTATVVAGVAVGAAAGGYFGSTRTASYDASTSLSVLPDSTVTASTADTTTQDPTAYEQAQLQVLNSDGFAGRVRTALSLPANPDITATQIGQSFAVQIVATAPTQAEAVRIAGTAGAQYINLRKSSLSSTLNASLQATQTQLDSVGAQLVEAQKTGRRNQAPTPAETALSSQYQQLLSERADLVQSLSRVGRVASTLSLAQPQATTLSATTKYGVGGGILGALVALVIFFVSRRARSRVRSVSDLAALDVPTLLPVAARHRVDPRGGARAWASRASRLLAARLAGESPDFRGPIVLFGATHRVGTSYLATSIAAALADRGPVLLVLAGEVGDDAEHLSARTVTTDTPPDARLAIGSGRDATAGAIQRVGRSDINGVWVLPNASALVDGSPGVRSSTLIDVLRRATAAGWMVVVDGPPTSESNLALECRSAGGVAALVVRRGHSTPADVVATAELFGAHDVAVSGAILNDVPGRLWRAFRRSVATPDAAVTELRETPAASAPPVPPPPAGPPRSERSERSDRERHDKPSDNARREHASAAVSSDHG